MYQWARFRFGVFDEKPLQNEPLLYPVDDGEDYEGSRCSLQIPGTTKIQVDMTFHFSSMSMNKSLVVSQGNHQ